MRNILIILLALLILLGLTIWLLVRSHRKNKELQAACDNYRRQALALQTLLDQSATIRERQQQAEKELDDVPDEDLHTRANGLFPAK